MALEQKPTVTSTEQWPEINAIGASAPGPSSTASLHPTPRDEEAPPHSAFSIVEPTAQVCGVTTHVSVSDQAAPDGGTRSWLVIVGSFFLLMATYGMMNSTGVLQNYFAEHQLSDYSTSAVGWVPGTFTFFGLVLSAQIGSLFDRYGPTGILITGSGCYVAGILLLAKCRLYWHFILTLGVLTGTGAALLSTAAMAAVPHWFDRRVGLAIGTAMAGAGLGGVMFPLVLRTTFARFGYKWAIRLLALMVGVMCALGVALVRSRLPKGRSKSTINLRAFKDVRFTWLTLGTFSTCTIIYCV